MSPNDEGTGYIPPPGQFRRPWTKLVDERATRHTGTPWPGEPGCLVRSQPREVRTGGRAAVV